ncbi:cytochrome c oxidase assembly protein [Ruixingdingia sedimenti]|uniref:Cytochrome c oxidase assembly protein CtaG n=1 Tax=Ruixingdingia sedimenti TaxID=3073604 RepID=A0ABU1FB46_9RHOB|nr:cytochrome c oxidase assembly protein [Xinfangfangia sp. LG-4]MDR5654123.1 cytochrome c oxidase assembly protein [Xinfangfangia sp. LG-4]
MKGPARTAAQLAGVAVVMAALSFAAVPFYDWFCRVTGFGGTTATAVQAPAGVLDRTVKVRFDASLGKDMPWRFKPAQREMEIRIGEVGLAFYEAHNPTDRRIAGTASYNVAPFSAGGYFTKIDCFCFEMQVLEPGETMQMPVTFYIDPDIVTDREGKYVREITLSYTFHTTDLPADTAAATKPPATGTN